MRATWAFLLALLLATALGACGDDGDGDGRREPERAQPDENPVQEAQRLTRVSVPEGAREVTARVDGAMDVSAALSFTTDAASARAAVDAAKLQSRPGFELSLYEDLWKGLGPRPSKLDDVVGIEEDQGSGLRVVVYGTRPDGDVTVYAYASTT